MGTTTIARFDPATRLRGEVRPPADKSISHRAAILGAMAGAPVKVTNYLAAADTSSTLDAIRAVGAAVATRPDGTMTITGVGLRGARAPGRTIDVGNAGTLMRLLPGWLAAQDGRAFTLDGDESIRRRPVDRIAKPLTAMGARIEARDGRLPPFTVIGAPAPSRDHTERMLAAAGAAVRRRGRELRIEPAPADGLQIDAITVPGDP